ncbi:ribonuclease P protein component [Gloeothece verrucosa]|uniref:Ribonuclease P protein component n=1 Tax=Gloeothece verrucosa (strain PCC 7822) TaxID=497965 RepID=E0U6K1_GLOV7|nr:ribonuclease P protein component [Gloeothece verrucosa]ADN14760.1 ribonuclease P protein component [Gloeothece verrucosa PCC 7822]
MGLPQEHRLKRRQDFQKVYKQGGRYSSPHLIIRTLFEAYLENSIGSQPSCFGISVSQKVSKKAVGRNRLKRLIRKAIRQLLPEIAPGWKVVIVVRAGSLECKYEHFLRELKQLLIKAEIIHGH